MATKYVFKMNQKVKLSMSGEEGEVIGRAEYAYHPPSYYVRFVAADGRQCEDWFSDNALAPVNPPRKRAVRKAKP